MPYPACGDQVSNAACRLTATPQLHGGATNRTASRLRKSSSGVLVPGSKGSWIDANFSLGFARFRVYAICEGLKPYKPLKVEGKKWP